ncbi:MAG: hypothetical protein ACRECJ_02170, partial [Limisphaerales bacterium]
MKSYWKTIAAFLFLLALVSFTYCVKGQKTPAGSAAGFDGVIGKNAQQMLAEGKQTFRFDTFGDEEFWGGALK